MKNLKKDLQALGKNLNALSKKVDNLIVAVGKFEKPKVTRKPKAKAVKAKPKKKAVVKKPAAKKTRKATAADAVFNVIKRYKKGVGTAALVDKTGFNEKKVYNIIYKLKKQGVIKSGGRGIYVKA